MKLLLGKGARVDAVDDTWGTVMHDAESVEVARETMGGERGAGCARMVWAVDYHGATALRFYADRWKVEMMEWALRMGWDVDGHDRRGGTPLRWVAEEGEEDEVRREELEAAVVLLDAGARMQKALAGWVEDERDEDGGEESRIRIEERLGLYEREWIKIGGRSRRRLFRFP